MARWSGWSTGPAKEDDSGPRSRPTATMLEDPMLGRIGSPRDPFEGRGARRRQMRLRVEGVLAISLAIPACGLTLALWLRTLAPLVDRLGLT